MNTVNQNLFDLVSSFDRTARIAALRGISNSTLARAIGSVRQDIRNRKFKERDEEKGQTDLDQRNEIDYEALGIPDEVRQQMGFDETISPLKQASIFHAIHNVAAADLETLAQNRRERPFTLEGMLTFMIDKARPLDETFANEMAAASGISAKLLRQMDELQGMQEREQLKAAAPEIRLTIGGFGDNGYEDAIADVPAVIQHQLGIKALMAIRQTFDQTLLFVLKSRKLSSLSDLPILRAAAKQLRAWLEDFETKHDDALQAAIDLNRTIVLLEDVEEIPEA